MRPVEVITSVERRRRWSRDEKPRIVAESAQAGRTTSQVARDHAPGQLFIWRRQLLAEAIANSAATDAFVPVSRARVPPVYRLKAAISPPRLQRQVGCALFVPMSVVRKMIGQWIAALFKSITYIYHRHAKLSENFDKRLRVRERLSPDRPCYRPTVECARKAGKG
jgi:transposase-like protein